MPAGREGRSHPQRQNTADFLRQKWGLGGGTDPDLSKESRVSLGSHKKVERAPLGFY